MEIKLPEHIHTQRLTLRRPKFDDAEAIFENYASDTEVTKYLAWPRHCTLRETLEFLHFANSQWEEKRGGAYLITLKHNKRVIGSTGIDPETMYRASTGYVLEKPVWGLGYATESLKAIIEVAQQTLIQRLQAHCHVLHKASARVLEKCGFICEGTLRAHTVFPNLQNDIAADIFSYSLLIPR